MLSTQTAEGYPVPHLSIIIPHRNSSVRMEETLVSVLENRPNNCEVLVVHDGSYRDPYELSNEVVFVQAERGSNLLQLINEATYACCAPVVNVLMDGVRVTAGWADSPLSHFEDCSIGAVSPIAQLAENPSKRFAGINASATLGKQLNSIKRLGTAGAQEDCIGPLLACGFYRRKTLLALEGWYDRLEPSVADIDLALALSKLQFRSVVDRNSQVEVCRELADCGLAFRDSRQLAAVLTAYQRASSKWQDVAMRSVHHVVRGACLPKGWLAALADWQGTYDQATAKRLMIRLDNARHELESRAQSSADVMHLQSQRAASSAVPQFRFRKAA